MEYTSQGQGTLNTVLGAVGTYGTMINGGLGNLFGGNNNQQYTQNILDIVDLKTENAILKGKIDVNDKIAALESKVDGIAAAQSVVNCGVQSSLAVLQSQASQFMDLTKLMISSTNVYTASTNA